MSHPHDGESPRLLPPSAAPPPKDVAGAAAASATVLLGPGSAVQVGEDDPLLTGAQAPAAVPTAPVASPETILLTAAETKPDESPAGLLPTIAIGAAAPPALALTVEGSAAK